MQIFFPGGGWRRFAFLPKSIWLIALILLLFLSKHAEAGVMYGATAAGSQGRLYLINPTNGAMLQQIGLLNDTNGVNYPITGLAFHPFTGVLYGSTGNNPVATAARLVRINPITATVTVVGQFNTGNPGTPPTMTDLAFHPTTGALYGISSHGGPQLYSINPATAQATLVGNNGLTLTGGGGLAISADGIFYATPTPVRFGTYNPVTGNFTEIAVPNFPLGGACSSLDFDENGTLYGINLDQGDANLITFALVTGQITNLGPTIASLDAIVFLPPPRLQLISAGNQVTLRWPSSPLFQLEYRTNLTSGIWLTNTTPPVLMNDTNTLTLTPERPAQFFRLRKP